MNHDYLTKKKIKNYGLKTIRDSLVVPLYSTTNVKPEIRSLQYIDKKGEKRFVSASEVKGSVHIVGFSWSEWQDLDQVLIVEGLATAYSVFEATNLAVCCVFSANFGLTALTNLRKLTKAKFLICFDNDSNSIGQKKAEEITSAINNTVVRLPSIVGDFNDLHQEQGLVG